jgi:hypothetical protein
MLHCEPVKAQIACFEAQGEAVIVQKGGRWWIRKVADGHTITKGPYRWKWVAVLLWPLV